MTYLLALDPGGTTGWSWWHYDDSTPLTHLDHGMIGGGVEGFVKWWGLKLFNPNLSGMRGREWDEDFRNPREIWHIPPAELVVESFVLDGRTASPDVTPLRIEGALVALWPHFIHYQRNVMKRAAPDEFLKKNDLWWKGAGHDRDSARHAFAHMREIKHLPTLRKFWAPE